MDALAIISEGCGYEIYRKESIGRRSYILTGICLRSECDLIIESQFLCFAVVVYGQFCLSQISRLYTIESNHASDLYLRLLPAALLMLVRLYCFKYAFCKYAEFYRRFD